MQAFIPLPTLFAHTTRHASPTSLSRLQTLRRQTVSNPRHCRIVVSAQTADEVIPINDASADFSPQHKPLSDEEDSAASIDSAIDNLSLSTPPAPDVASPPADPSPAASLKPPPRPARPARPAPPVDRRFQRTDRRGGEYTPPPPFIPDPNATYYTSCGKCTAAYEIDPKDLNRGRRVSCSVCGNTWFQRPDRLLTYDKESQEMTDYPVEKKDELIAKREQIRRDRARTPFRGNNNRDGGDREGAPRYSPDRRGGRDGRFDRRGGGGGGGGPVRNRSQFSVFLGNLPYTVTEEDLRAMITDDFNVMRVSVIKDMETGRSKGYAFCDLGSEVEVDKLVSLLDGVDVKGRRISARAGKKNPS